MLSRARAFCAPFLLVVLVHLCAGSAATAQERAWRVSKSSGDISVISAAGEQTALTEASTLNPGDNIRTGQNGRALLVRGEETIMISPNTVMGIPAGKRENLSTSIALQAGSLLLEVEKKNVKHFEVETPYLAAVVKGTQFRVTVAEKDTRVDVLRGQVEVMDFKSGQYALVQPDQAARVSLQGPAGLSLSGPGALSPIQLGAPRRSSVAPLPAPAANQAASDHMSNEPPVRVAQLSEGKAAPPTWSGRNTPKEEPWSFSLSSFGKYFGSGNGKRNQTEDLTLAVAIACGMGLFVSLAVSGARRWRKRKQIPT